jgi:D-alanine transaminase
VQVTRGVEGERNHVPLAGTRPTVFASVQKLPATPAAVIEQGVAAITAEDIRWSRCDIKSTSLLGNVLLRWLAADSGATESVLLRDGVLTEGSTSSAHVVKGGRIATPPQTNAILPGTTRGVIFELAGREGIASERRPVTEAEVRGADELIIASAGAGIRAVTSSTASRSAPARPGRYSAASTRRTRRRSGSSRPNCRHERARRALPVPDRVPDQGDGPRLGVVQDPDACDRRATRRATLA